MILIPQAMSEYDNDTEVAKDPIAKTRKWSRHLRLQQSPVNGCDACPPPPFSPIKFYNTNPHPSPQVAPMPATELTRNVHTTDPKGARGDGGT